MSTLHLVVVADTNDPRIGSTVKIDVDRIQSTFLEYSQLAEMWFSLRVLQSNTFRSDEIIKALQNFSVDTDDTVVFYYSGHGFRNESKIDPWPLIALKLDMMNGIEGFDTKWIYNILQQKNPRLLIMMTDSCQEIVPDHQSTITSPYNSRNLSDRSTGCKKLFKESQGEALFISCQPGEFSYCDDQHGGFFTYTLMKSIEDNVQSRSPTWELVAQGAEDLSSFKNRQHPLWRVVRSSNYAMRSVQFDTLDNWKGRGINKGESDLQRSLSSPAGLSTSLILAITTLARENPVLIQSVIKVIKNFLQTNPTASQKGIGTQDLIKIKESMSNFIQDPEVREVIFTVFMEIFIVLLLPKPLQMLRSSETTQGHSYSSPPVHSSQQATPPPERRSFSRPTEPAASRSMNTPNAHGNTCPNCHFNNGARSKFCRKCGTLLS